MASRATDGGAGGGAGAGVSSTATTTTTQDIDAKLVLRAVALAQAARERGNHPFGALLATASGDIVVECENSVVTDKDITAHAELALVRKASKALAPAYLQTLTLYTSTEPCAMCAGAIFWSGIPRVVYGCSETSLYALTGNPVAKKLVAAADTAAAATAHSKDSADELIAAGGAHTLFLPCRDVFAHGGRKISVTGPVEEEAARKPHEGFWV